MGGQQFGPYELVRPIASGGMAELYLVKAQGFAGFEKFLALKVIHPDFASDADFVAMLVEEAKLAVQLQHGNIAQTFDLGRVGDIYYIAMEFVDGVDLYRVLRYSGDNDVPLPISLCAYVIREALQGLDYAHRKTAPNGTPLGIVHRDVSPQNMLVSYTGEVKLVDFGIAKASMRAKKTAIGVLKGKYYYMSPEQAWGEAIDARSDIFSMGIVLYELLVGQMLFVDDDLAVVLEMVRKADVVPPSRLRREIPPALDAIVMRALAKRPDDRFASAREFAVALDGFLRGSAPFNALMLSDYIRNHVGGHGEPGAAASSLGSAIPTQEDAGLAAARVTAVSKSKAAAVPAQTTPMRSRPVPARPTSDRKISSFAETNQMMHDREVDDTNSLIFTETDLGGGEAPAKLEAARAQFRRESLGVPTSPMPRQISTRARRASEQTAERLPPQALIAPTPAPQPLPAHLTSGSRPAVPSVPPPTYASQQMAAASAASHPVALADAIGAAVAPLPPAQLSASDAQPQGWTRHALVAWLAAFGAFGAAVAIGYALYLAQLGPARAWVDATVAGATVTVDDGAPQATGGAVALTPGTPHTLRVRKPGFRPVEREVTVARGETVYFLAALTPLVTLTVPGAAGGEVRVDGKLIGVTPLDAVAVEARGVSVVERVTPQGDTQRWVVNFDATPVVRLEPR